MLAYIHLCLCSDTVQAQKGTPYITNFSNIDHFDFRIWDISKTLAGEMLFAHKKGLVSFNGSEWHAHNLSEVSLVLAKHIDGSLIVAIPAGFG